MPTFCLRIFFLVFVGCSMWHTDLLAQQFTFADTYPTNNVDSLENWLKTHPQPTEERLKNLIRLHRTWRYGYLEKIEKNLPELKLLSYRLNNPIGKAYYTLQHPYLLFSKGKGGASFLQMTEALQVFETLKDTSGIIQALADLVFINFDRDGSEIGSQALSKEYLQRITFLLKKKPNNHDYIYCQRVIVSYYLGKHGTDYEQLIPQTKALVKLCESNPAYQYAVWRSYHNLSVVLSSAGHFQEAYTIDKNLLDHTKPEQFEEQVAILGNLAEDCYDLKKFDELLDYGLQKLRLLTQAQEKKQPVNPIYYVSLYYSLKHEMTRRKNYVKALEYGEKLYFAQQNLYTYRQEQKIANLLTHYQAAEKQKQIAELTLQQTQTQNRNRLTLILLSIAFVVAVVFGYLGVRLRRANQQLHQLTQAREQLLGIVAHDLRRPLSTFHGMAEMVNSALKMRDFTAIEALSRSIDQSGAKIQQLLDNIVAWALSQYVELPHHPVFFPLQERLLNTVNIYRNIYAAKKPSFEVLLDKTWQLYMDVDAFDLIVRNLIDNSLKATDQPVHIKITARYPSPQYIEVCFEDNAGGIAPSQRLAIQRAFDTPYQAQTNENGLGMGILMISRFVKRNRGTIAVESPPKNTTKFILLLPTTAAV